MRHDPSAHAEIVKLRKLGQTWKTTEFRDCTLYCRLQPCGMCAVACIWGKIHPIVYGATRNDVHSHVLRYAAYQHIPPDSRRVSR
jgi:tRNA(adenine34) deaminase